MNKIIYLLGAVVIIVGLVFVLRGDGEEAKEIISGDFVDEVELLDNQEAATGTKATDYNSSRSNRTTSASVDGDTDDYGDNSVENAVDNDCDDPHGEGSACAPGDPIPGIGITAEQGSEASKLDDDDDNDGIPTEEGLAEMRAVGYIKIGDIEGDASSD
jgi:hypothetical protein